MATPTTLPATFVAGNVLTATQMNNLRGAFRVLQTVSTTKTDTFSSTANSTWTDITGYSVSITPSSTSSKVLIVVNMNCSVTRPTQINRAWRLMRGATPIGVGDAAGSRLQGSMDGGSTQDEFAVNLGYSFLDSPNTTSATTYNIQFRQTNGSYTFYLNRSGQDTDNTNYARTASTITAFEISA